MNIIALIRTHNSEWIIWKTLEALTQVVDGFIIHDDNSTDKTVEMCKSYSKCLEVFENKKTFYHEGIDKAILLNLGRKYNPNWFLFMDDDEVIIPELFKTYNFYNRKSVYLFPLLYFWGSDNKIRVDGSWEQQVRTKLVPNTADLYTPMKICHCSPEYELEKQKLFVPCPILHYGYNSKEKIKEKLNLYNEFPEEVNQMTKKQLNKAFNSKPKLVGLKKALKLEWITKK